MRRFGCAAVGAAAMLSISTMAAQASTVFTDTTFSDLSEYTAQFGC
jgi:hypothetical protein